ncbi:HAD family phosphatase [Saccharothrix syringae]|uniref:HAD family phosphatase n=1 Tax=Saccharothrix syringae TaxID=103733 RepID=A0A5Q0HD84_SACSY|nr:HAD family phosphatase [Saccharothrix syringae]
MRAVWTDFDGVVTPPVDLALAEVSRRVGRGLTPDLLRSAMEAVGRSMGTDAMAPLDTPLLTEEQWARQVEQVLLERHELRVDLSDFGGKWFADRPADEHWVEFLMALRRSGFFVGLLSNTPPAWERHWRRLVAADLLFDAVVSSHQVRCRKPEAAIFDLAAARAGLAPDQCVLVDDQEVHCEGARAAGWHAVHFTDVPRAASALNELLSRQPVRSVVR